MNEHEKKIKANWEKQRNAANNAVLQAAENCPYIRTQFMPRKKVYRLKLVKSLSRTERAKTCPGWKIYNLLKRATNNENTFNRAVVSVYGGFCDIKLA